MCDHVRLSDRWGQILAGDLFICSLDVLRCSTEELRRSVLVRTFEGLTKMFFSILREPQQMWPNEQSFGLGHQSFVGIKFLRRCELCFCASGCLKVSVRGESASFVASNTTGLVQMGNAANSRGINYAHQVLPSNSCFFSRH